MAPLTGPVLAAALVLVAAGVPKLVRPLTTVGALRSVGIPASAALVRCLAAGEVAVGAGAVARGGRVMAVLVAASYAVFAAFLVVALRRGGAVSSCGCLGRADTPPTRTHLVVAALLGLLAAVAVVDPPGGVVAAVRAGADGVLTLAFAMLAGWLVWLTLAELPRLRVTT
jgi:hypothetical protein